jgi:hypothetical protein
MHATFITALFAGLLAGFAVVIAGAESVEVEERHLDCGESCCFKYEKSTVRALRAFSSFRRRDMV